MIYIECDRWTEIRPETREDVEQLQKRYPHCFPCAYVRVEKKHAKHPVGIEGFIAKHAYDVSRDKFRICISCGSQTQPCCGH